MKEVKGVIANVKPGSLAEQHGVAPGDKIISVNGTNVRDLIDLSFAVADESVHLVTESDGKKVEHYFQKRFDEDLGVELESAVFDSIRQCANHCIFCFIDQMKEGLRDSLYVRDDDYRMSFLYGNYITLTNMTDADYKRIQQYHLSPLYVSVHTTNGELRQNMMKQPRSAQIMKDLQRLIDMDIEFHCQVVLCPGYNDREELKRTLQDLSSLYPSAQSVAIVPLGMTKHREGLTALQPVDEKVAKETIQILSSFQKEMREKHGTSFAYLADEFYIKAGVEVPTDEWYDGYPQLEDGIGMMRYFAETWSRTEVGSYEGPRKKVTLVTGTAVAPFVQSIVQDTPHVVRVKAIENHFFGTSITVTGLVTATDILEQTKDLDTDVLIIPGVMLRKGEPIFLDGMTLDSFKGQVPYEVQVCDFAGELKEYLYQN